MPPLKRRPASLTYSSLTRQSAHHQRQMPTLNIIIIKKWQDETQTMEYFDGSVSPPSGFAGLNVLCILYLSTLNPKFHPSCAVSVQANQHLEYLIAASENSQNRQRYFIIGTHSSQRHVLPVNFIPHEHGFCSWPMPERTRWCGMCQEAKGRGATRLPLPLPSQLPHRLPTPPGCIGPTR